MSIRTPLKWIVALATLKIVAAVLGFVVGEDPGRFAAQTPLPWSVNLVLVLVFALAAAVLLIGSRHDKRAGYLGAFYLLVATAYSNRLILALADVLPGALSRVVLVLKSLEVDAFLGFVLWLFVSGFPETILPRGSRLFQGTMIRLAGVIGGGLFLFNFIANQAGDSVREWVGDAVFVHLTRDVGGMAFYLPILLLTVIGLAFLWFKARRADVLERRRVRVFFGGLLLGFTPVTLALLIEALIPATRAWLSQPAVRLSMGAFLIFPALLSIPFTTAYAVARHRVLDIRLIARRTLQYALARGGAIALAAAPFAVLCWFLIVHRNERLVDLASGQRIVPLATATVLGALALIYRQRILDAVDRRFFRDRYDARQILDLLGEQVRSVGNETELSELIAGGIDRALRLESSALLLERQDEGIYSDPTGRVRLLDATGHLVNLVHSVGEPLEVALDRAASPLRSLPIAERHWLVDSRAALLMPVLALDGSLVAILVLGAKRSELPFLKEDGELLRSVAHSVALVIELLRLRESPNTLQAAGPVAGDGASSAESAAEARECGLCGRLFTPRTNRCEVCGVELGGAGVPFVLPGRFRFDRKLGVGGMGLVYLANDLALGRPVAVKTLRQVSPEGAMRLRREARAAAAVNHPHLAAVHGLETWKGTPLLILEYLEGGTLGQRIESSPLSIEETIDLGIKIAAALETLHDVDILHRDIKPSNIGFGAAGQPKLMDFGIARVQYDEREDSDVSPASDGLSDTQLPATVVWEGSSPAKTKTGHVVGTVAYLAPEALEGARAAPDFDLWSLAIVLLESLTARAIFKGKTTKTTMVQVLGRRVPEIETLVPDSPGPVVDFFRRALSADRAERPQTARDFRRQLRTLQ